MASKVPTDESTNELSSSSSESISDDDEVEHRADFIYQQLTQTTDQKSTTDKDKQVVIVTAGKSGSGKSTLINNFLQLKGDDVLEARMDPDPVTTKVKHCDKEINQKEINGVKVRVIDMPGLHAPGTSGKTKNILRDLKAATGEGADVVFYCIKLDDRIETVDYQNMDTLTKAFGPQIWKHVIIVFTRTDYVLFKKSNPEELIDQHIKKLKEYLKVDIKSINSFPTDSDECINNFNGIVGIPVSEDPNIPAGWRTTLLLQVLRNCRKENIPAFLKLNDINWREVAKTTGIVATSGVGGAAVGTAVGATIGAIVGGVVTAPIGGVGAAGGAAIGAICGSGSIGLSTIMIRIARIIYSRSNTKRRAYRKTKKPAKKEQTP